LKPDACRRVEGRLPPAFGCRLSAFGRSQNQEPQAEARDAILALETRDGTSCEIVRTYARIRLSRLARST